MADSMKILRWTQKICRFLSKMGTLKANFWRTYVRVSVWRPSSAKGKLIFAGLASNLCDDLTPMSVRREGKE